MKLKLSELVPGTLLTPPDGAERDCWCPFITVMGPGKRTDSLHIKFSDGRESFYFCPNGTIQFKVYATGQLEND